MAKSYKAAGKQLNPSFLAPKWDKPESKRYAIQSPMVDLCLIVVMGESQIQDIVAKVLFFHEY